MIAYTLQSDLVKSDAFYIIASNKEEAEQVRSYISDKIVKLDSTYKLVKKPICLHTTIGFFQWCSVPNNSNGFFPVNLREWKISKLDLYDRNEE